MVELWTSRGLDKNTATDVIEKISKYPAFFADIMMKVICTGFLCFGLVPLRSLRLYLLLLIFFSSSFPVILQDELNLPYPDAHPVQTSISSCCGFWGGAMISSLPVLVSRLSGAAAPLSHRSALAASVAVAAAVAAAANYKRCDSKNISNRQTLALGSLSCVLAIATTFCAARAAFRQ
jgi:hypothetical protein